MATGVALAGADLAQEPRLEHALWAGGVHACTFVFFLYAQDLYDLRVAAADRVRGARVLRAAMFAALCSIVIGVGTGALPAVLAGSALAAPLGAMVVRDRLFPVYGRPRRVLVVGAGKRAQALVEAVRDQGDERIELCPRGASVDLDRVPPGSVVRLANREGVDEVVVALDEARGKLPLEDLIRCRLSGKPVLDSATFCESVLRRISLSQVRTSFFALGAGLASAHGPVKRALDVAIGLAGLAVALPVLAILAVAIKADSEGPVLYSQARVGLGGRVFRLWKLRSMRSDAEREGAVWARSGDDRITRVGRFIRKSRLDELPQLFNVLAGDMSLVGPRPERPVFVERLKAEVPFYALREAVRPGITGWAQIRYPYGASVEDAQNKLEFDLYYLKNGTLFLDLAILFHTVRHVLWGRGAR